MRAPQPQYPPRGHETSTVPHCIPRTVRPVRNPLPTRSRRSANPKNTGRAPRRYRIRPDIR
ncbi:hypothetical protein HMPREF0742_01828 [Rothia aeria F0184]|uniref:Uncharacterized protein n=1 Tax=Rothia aeria F0184 TaxID=888019 RepID=U7V3V6_9MICC|nr:hypothetical protein HMPREF0742_01828 [Rothia aeria F0184]